VIEVQTMLKRRAGLAALLLINMASPATPQASPTQAAFLDKQLGNASLGINGQFQLIQQRIVAGNATPKILIAAHQKYMNVGRSGSLTAAQTNAYTDTFKAAGMTYMLVNADGNLFVGSSHGAALALLDQEYTYAAGTDGMNVQLNFSFGNPAQGAAFPYVTAQCVITPSWCDVNGYFKDFASMQTASLTVVTAMLTRWGAAGIIGSKLSDFSCVHEPAGLTNNGLFFAPWSPTNTGGPGSPTDWSNYITACASAVHAIAGGTCTNCPTLEISAATTAADSDLTNFCPVFASNTSLGSVALDVYAKPTGNLFNYLLTAQSTCINAIVAAGKVFGVEETSPPWWTPGYVSTGSEGNAYKGLANAAWDGPEDIEWVKTMALFVSAVGGKYLGIFSSAKLALYCAGAACSTAVPPDPTCGDDGTQCLGDQDGAAPFASVTLPAALSANIAAGTVALTPVGKYIKQLNDVGFRGAY